MILGTKRKDGTDRFFSQFRMLGNVAPRRTAACFCSGPSSNGRALMWSPSVLISLG